jgi:hypothetical protein
MTILIKSKRLLFDLMVLLFLILLIFRVTTHIRFEGRGWSTYLPYILFLTVELGFLFHENFSNDSALCLVLNDEQIYSMLITY